MSQSGEKLITPTSFIIDGILVVGFFAFMFSVLRSHVPSFDPVMITLWAAFAAGCMSGVFWLAIQMFRVVLRAQRAAKIQTPHKE